MKSPPIPTLRPAPEPDAEADLAVLPVVEVLVYGQVPAVPPGIAPVFSSADDMDFDIVSTRR